MQGRHVMQCLEVVHRTLAHDPHTLKLLAQPLRHSLVLGAQLVASQLDEG